MRIGWTYYPRAVLLPAVVCFAVASVSAQPSLLMCFPGASNIQTIQNCYDSLLGEGKTAGFARIKDLEATIAIAPHAALIVPEPYIRYSKNYSPILRAHTQGSAAETYVIATAAPLTRDELSGKRVAILDFIGREKLPLFVKEYFGLDLPPLKRANKTGDLLIMLGMETVDAIIVSASDLKELSANTRQTLTVVMESLKPVPGMVLATRTGRNVAPIKKVILNSTASQTSATGITKWEEKKP